MISKTDTSLLNWIYKHVIDFTDENDNSGLTWESTNKEALSFMNGIPKKEKVQKYGVYSAKSYLFVVDEFDDIKEGLHRNFFYATIKNLVDLGVMECVNPETEHGRMYIITEKGERVLGLL